eukprot:GHUV01054931.1.p1 GENE.GHUV01054931.1~~GHUV01054931.1.p1  ORF type:complete len:212 (+),score=62.41 GHUV01054931.1:118-753(+)
MPTGSRLLAVISCCSHVSHDQDTLNSKGQGTTTLGTSSSNVTLSCGTLMQMIMEDAMVVKNKAMRNGGGFLFDVNVHAELNNCTIMFNSAIEDGGGFAAAAKTVLILHDTLVASNRAGRGGGIMTGTTAQLVLLGDTDVTNNSAENGYGGGVTLFSGRFSPNQVKRVVHSNHGLYSADVQSLLTNLTIVGNNTVNGFANLIGKDEGLLHVV